MTPLDAFGNDLANFLIGAGLFWLVLRAVVGLVRAGRHVRDARRLVAPGRRFGMDALGRGPRVLR